jgi:hypothetical protein
MTIVWSFQDLRQIGSNPVVPAKSHFDQVHVASTASEPNLAKTPFSGTSFLGSHEALLATVGGNG